MLALQSRAIDLCKKAVRADRTQGEERRALYFYKQSLGKSINAHRVLTTT